MAEARARANDNINTIRNQTSVAYVNPPLSALDTVESEMKSRQNKREHVTKQTYTTASVACCPGSIRASAGNI